MFIMKILEFNYNEDARTLYVEFSMPEDGDDYYRSIWLSVEEIEYYSPTILSENDLFSIEHEFITEILTGYFEDNNLPEERTL